MESRKRRGVSILGPVIVIGLGTILLLNTLGILEWSIWWQLLRLWPLLLIAAGLDLLIGRRSIWASLVVTVVVVGLAVAALWLMQRDAAGSEFTSHDIRQPLGSASRAEVAIDSPLGVLRIDALSEEANLVEGVVHLRPGEEVQEDFSQAGAQATYSLKTEGDTWMPFTTSWDERLSWDLGLSPGAVLELKTSLGLGDSLVDLAGLRLASLSVDMGVGRTRVYLPAEGSFEAKVDQAIGAVEIVVPEGLAVRVQADTALVARNLPDDFQDHGEGLYTSPGYDSATHRVNLEVDQAIGAVTIRYED